MPKTIHIFIHGEQGSGKTRAVQQIATALHNDGFNVRAIDNEGEIDTGNVLAKPPSEFSAVIVTQQD